MAHDEQNLMALLQMRQLIGVCPASKFEFKQTEVKMIKLKDIKSIPMKEKGIDIQMKFESITGYTQDVMTSLDEIVTNDSRVYYTIKKFVKL